MVVRVGVMSVLAAVMTALQTTLRHQELAERHREAGARYYERGQDAKRPLKGLFCIQVKSLIAFIALTDNSMLPPSPHII